MSPTLKEGCGEAVVARDMSDPFEIPSLDSRQKRFLSAHKDVHLAPHPVVGLYHLLRARPELDWLILSPTNGFKL